MIPTIYYDNLFARVETLHGSQADADNPVRRVADGDLALRYYLFDAPGSPASGVVSGTLADADTRGYYVQARATSVSGFTVRVYSSDVGGGNQAQHLERVLSGDESFVATLSGVGTARRVWWVEYGTNVSGLGICNLYEIMLARQMVFPRGASVGVARSTQQNYQRMDVPGAASFKLRLGEDYRRVTYNFAATSGEVAGVTTFLQTNDGGEPFWLVDDLGAGYWAELAESAHDFDDQAGIYLFGVGINEVPLEQ